MFSSSVFDENFDENNHEAPCSPTSATPFFESGAAPRTNGREAARAGSPKRASGSASPKKPAPPPLPARPSEPRKSSSSFMASSSSSQTPNARNSVKRVTSTSSRRSGTLSAPPSDEVLETRVKNVMRVRSSRSTILALEDAAGFVGKSPMSYPLTFRALFDPIRFSTDQPSPAISHAVHHDGFTSEEDADNSTDEANAESSHHVDEDDVTRLQNDDGEDLSYGSDGVSSLGTAATIETWRLEIDFADWIDAFHTSTGTWKSAQIIDQSEDGTQIKISFEDSPSTDDRWVERDSRGIAPHHSRGGGATREEWRDELEIGSKVDLFVTLSSEPEANWCAATVVGLNAEDGSLLIEWSDGSRTRRAKFQPDSTRLEAPGTMSGVRSKFGLGTGSTQVKITSIDVRVKYASEAFCKERGVEHAMEAFESLDMLPMNGLYFYFIEALPLLAATPDRFDTSRATSVVRALIELLLRHPEALSARERLEATSVSFERFLLLSGTTREDVSGLLDEFALRFLQVCADRNQQTSLAFELIARAAPSLQAPASSDFELWMAKEGKAYLLRNRESSSGFETILRHVSRMGYFTEADLEALATRADVELAVFQRSLAPNLKGMSDELLGRFPTKHVQCLYDTHHEESKFIVELFRRLPNSAGALLEVHLTDAHAVLIAEMAFQAAISTEADKSDPVAFVRFLIVFAKAIRSRSQVSVVEAIDALVRSQADKIGAAHEAQPLVLIDLFESSLKRVETADDLTKLWKWIRSETWIAKHANNILSTQADFKKDVHFISMEALAQFGKVPSVDLSQYPLARLSSLLTRLSTEDRDEELDAAVVEEAWECALRLRVEKESDVFARSILRWFVRFFAERDASDFASRLAKGFQEQKETSALLSLADLVLDLADARGTRGERSHGERARGVLCEFQVSAPATKPTSLSAVALSLPSSEEATSASVKVYESATIWDLKHLIAREFQGVLPKHSPTASPLSVHLEWELSDAVLVVPQASPLNGRTIRQVLKGKTSSAPLRARVHFHKPPSLFDGDARQPDFRFLDVLEKVFQRFRSEDGLTVEDFSRLYTCATGKVAVRDVIQRVVHSNARENGASMTVKEFISFYVESARARPDSVLRDLSMLGYDAFAYMSSSAVEAEEGMKRSNRRLTIEVEQGGGDLLDFEAEDGDRASSSRASIRRALVDVGIHDVLFRVGSQEPDAAEHAEEAWRLLMRLPTWSRFEDLVHEMDFGAWRGLSSQEATYALQIIDASSSASWWQQRWSANEEKRINEIVSCLLLDVNMEADATQFGLLFRVLTGFTRALESVSADLIEIVDLASLRRCVTKIVEGSLSTSISYDMVDFWEALLGLTIRTSDKDAEKEEEWILATLHHFADGMILHNDEPMRSRFQSAMSRLLNHLKPSTKAKRFTHRCLGLLVTGPFTKSLASLSETKKTSQLFRVLCELVPRISESDAEQLLTLKRCEREITGFFESAPWVTELSQQPSLVAEMLRAWRLVFHESSASAQEIQQLVRSASEVLVWSFGTEETSEAAFGLLAQVTLKHWSICRSALLPFLSDPSSSDLKNEKRRAPMSVIYTKTSPALDACLHFLSTVSRVEWQPNQLVHKALVWMKHSQRELVTSSSIGFTDSTLTHLDTSTRKSTLVSTLKQIAKQVRPNPGGGGTQRTRECLLCSWSENVFDDCVVNLSIAGCNELGDAMDRLMMSKNTSKLSMKKEEGAHCPSCRAAGSIFSDSRPRLSLSSGNLILVLDSSSGHGPSSLRLQQQQGLVFPLNDFELPGNNKELARVVGVLCTRRVKSIAQEAGAAASAYAAFVRREDKWYQLDGEGNMQVVSDLDVLADRVFGSVHSRSNSTTPTDEEVHQHEFVPCALSIQAVAPKPPASEASDALERERVESDNKALQRELVGRSKAFQGFWSSVMSQLVAAKPQLPKPASDAPPLPPPPIQPVAAAAKTPKKPVPSDEFVLTPPPWWPAASGISNSRESLSQRLNSRKKIDTGTSTSTSLNDNSRSASVASMGPSSSSGADFSEETRKELLTSVVSSCLRSDVEDQSSLISAISSNFGTHSAVNESVALSFFDKGNALTREASERRPEIAASILSCLVPSIPEKRRAEIFDLMLSSLSEVFVSKCLTLNAKLLEHALSNDGLNQSLVGRRFAIAAVLAEGASVEERTAQLSQHAEAILEGLLSNEETQACCYRLCRLWPEASTTTVVDVVLGQIFEPSFGGRDSLWRALSMFSDLKAVMHSLLQEMHTHRRTLEAPVLAGVSFVLDQCEAHPSLATYLAQLAPHAPEDDDRATDWVARFLERCLRRSVSPPQPPKVVQGLVESLTRLSQVHDRGDAVVGRVVKFPSDVVSTRVRVALARVIEETESEGVLLRVLAQTPRDDVEAYGHALLFHVVNMRRHPICLNLWFEETGLESFELPENGLVTRELVSGEARLVFEGFIDVHEPSEEWWGKYSFGWEFTVPEDEVEGPSLLEETTMLMVDPTTSLRRKSMGTSRRFSIIGGGQMPSNRRLSDLATLRRQSSLQQSQQLLLESSHVVEEVDVAFDEEFEASWVANGEDPFAE